MIRLGTVTLIVLVLIFVDKSAQKVIELDEDNWSDMLKDEWMVKFHAPWCPACRGMESVWKLFAEQGSQLGIKVGKVDVTTSPGLSGRFMVSALPTIYHVINGEFRQYKGSRDKDSFVTFVKDKKWEQVEAIPGWKGPNSIQMGIVSSFFKLSRTLRELHTALMEEYGLPTWGSYLIFAIATIILGVLLGFIMVCVLDLLFPPKQPHMYTVVNNKLKESDNELPDEDIPDDLVEDTQSDENNEDQSQESQEEEEDNPQRNSTRRRKTRRKE